MVEEELGIHIGACISSFQAAVRHVYQSKPDMQKAQCDYLSEIFGMISRIPRRNQTAPKTNDIPAKAAALIETLCTEMDALSTELVFVHGQAMVVAPGGLLTAHFGRDSRFRIGTLLTQVWAPKPERHNYGIHIALGADPWRLQEWEGKPANRNWSDAASYQYF